MTATAAFTRSAHVEDDLDIDDATVVLLPGTLLVLRGLDRELFRVLGDRPRTAPQLAVELADAHDAECTDVLLADVARQLDWLETQEVARSSGRPAATVATPPAQRSGTAPGGTTVPLDVMGVRIDVGFHPADVDAARAFTSAWDRCLASPGQPAQLAVDAPRGGTAYALTSTVTHAAIMALRGSRLMLHATAVQTGENAVTVFVGASGSGKTTLARTLGRRFGYVTDETVSLDPASLTVTPFPKPLCLVREGAPTKAVEAPDALGLVPLADPSGLRVTRLLFIDRQQPGWPGAPRIDTGLAEADVFALLAPHISALSALPAPLRTLQELIRSTETVGMVRYGDAETVGGLLTDP